MHATRNSVPLKNTARQAGSGYSIIEDGLKKFLQEALPYEPNALAAAAAAAAGAAT